VRRSYPSFDLTDCLCRIEDWEISYAFRPLIPLEEPGSDTIDTDPAYANPEVGPEYHDTYVDLFEPMEDCHGEI
jgi:hypothetical protein